MQGVGVRLERWFGLAERGSDFRTEVLAGVTTFATMAYILVVQPAVLSTDLAGRPTGLDFGAVFLATCLGSAFSSILMGVYARYPIALAPGMGQNVFFVTVVMGLGALGVPNGWQVALGMVFLAGVAFILLTLVGLREALIDAISPSMRGAIAAGIGLFIAFIGLRQGGLVVGRPATLVGLNPDLRSVDVAVFSLGLLVAAVLLARRVRGALLWGMVGAALLAALLGRIAFTGVVGWPPVADTAVLAMDPLGALQPRLVPFIIVFLFMGLFDTVGTLIGVSEQAGLLEGGRLPRANRALMSDAAGISVGAALGTSTITCYIESAAGVAAGGRTGLTAVVVGLLFVAALFFEPLVRALGSYPPVTAPALVLVGSLMMASAARIAWDDPSEALPVFLTIVGIPLTSSIADGLALGFVAYPIVKFLSGRGREVGWLSYIMAALLLAYFVFVRYQLG
ncbi:MAG TPA: NCS2 family permease [Vicinamibacterales bacterium]|nr:NCS2 family permease [Vicinamibacterales bacterium]